MWTVDTIRKLGCSFSCHDKTMLIFAGMEMFGCIDTICCGSDMLGFYLDAGMT